jgi:hypothetical protein
MMAMKHIKMKYLIYSLLVFYSLFVAACKEEDNADLPSIIISQVAPVEGLRGTTVIVKGSGFGNEPQKIAVTFSNIAGKITALKDDEITVVVPEQAISGALAIARPSEQLVIALPFFRVAELREPFIEEVLPAGNTLPTGEVEPGDRIIIKGRNFSIFPANNYVTVSGASATVKSNCRKAVLSIIRWTHLLRNYQRNPR